MPSDGSQGDANLPAYTLNEVIGRGNFGIVYKGYNKLTKKVVAIKVLNLDTAEDEVKDVQREVALLTQLNQGDAQNIIRYHGSHLVGARLWIVMDYCSGGSVRTLLAMGKIEEKFTSVIVRELLLALHYIHRCGVIHRDIKAANILVTNDARVQLCDFGVAAQISANHPKRSTIAGTPYWMAPEVITEGASYNFKADIWSVGITVYEMSTGQPPYSEQDGMRAMFLIPRSKPPRLEGLNYSAALKEFLSLCLNERPDERPVAEELLKSKFVRFTKNLPTSSIKELVDRYTLWHNRGNVRKSISVPGRGAQHTSEDDDDADDDGGGWDFDIGNAAGSDGEPDVATQPTGRRPTAVDMEHEVRTLSRTSRSPSLSRQRAVSASRKEAAAYFDPDDRVDDALGNYQLRQGTISRTSSTADDTVRSTGKKPRSPSAADMSFSASLSPSSSAADQLPPVPPIPQHHTNGHAATPLSQHTVSTTQSRAPLPDTNPHPLRQLFTNTDNPPQGAYATSYFSSQPAAETVTSPIHDHLPSIFQTTSPLKTEQVRSPSPPVEIEIPTLDDFDTSVPVLPPPKPPSSMSSSNLSSSSSTTASTPLEHVPKPSTRLFRSNSSAPALNMYSHQHSVPQVPSMPTMPSITTISPNAQILPLAPSGGTGLTIQMPTAPILATSFSTSAVPTASSLGG
ncbi:kinase-like domain-containing protein, partial [Dipodascopsis tothii]|uniref:kinase-like domain-containing protein n=1 Tax=Dipodascopsis tothii TaxID=44089 RepID=UPI0034CE7A14